MMDELSSNFNLVSSSNNQPFSVVVGLKRYTRERIDEKLFHLKFSTSTDVIRWVQKLSPVSSPPSECKIDKVEMSPDSRIISIVCTIHGIKMQLINVYAHSGNSMNAARDELFEKDLVYYLRHNIPNSYMSGDWNCILNNRDV